MTKKIQVTPQLVKYQKKVKNTAADLAAAAMGMTVSPGQLMAGFVELENVAERIQKAIDASDAIFNFDGRPLKSDVSKARLTQAVRVNGEVFLPIVGEDFRVVPNACLRSAIFTTGRGVQLSNAHLLSGKLEQTNDFADVVSFDYIDAQLKGYNLCQYDRKVWGTCVEFYRDKPLTKEGASEQTETNFYGFAKKMGELYGKSTHRAILASLIRLDAVQFRIRYKGWNLRGQKILNASFQDGSEHGRQRGSDLIRFQVLDGVAELCGPQGWTALHKDILTYDGLMAWIAGFYASHSRCCWLPFEYLQKMTGYPGTSKNFKQAFVAAVEKLTSASVDPSHRIREYDISADWKKIVVARKNWKIPRAVDNGADEEDTIAPRQISKP
ncbi:hypothetical protein PQR63_15355 [Herbaspirillum rhizosphaerae]|uniref:P63C domain-containing protein n=1 Tax=Herbaspirillum rhizosphaerae TaxID=346179 RepID=A0ABW8Z9R1_9BURK